jgi:hypothetical protein
MPPGTQTKCATTLQHSSGYSHQSQDEVLGRRHAEAIFASAGSGYAAAPMPMDLLQRFRAVVVQIRKLT